MLSSPLNCIPKMPLPLTIWLHCHLEFLILSHPIMGEDVWNNTHWSKEMFHWNHVYSLVTFLQHYFSDNLCVKIVILFNTPSNNIKCLVNYSWRNVISCILVNTPREGKPGVSNWTKPRINPAFTLCFTRRLSTKWQISQSYHSSPFQSGCAQYKHGIFVVTSSFDTHI